jgi:hypothetical protein
MPFHFVGMFFIIICTVVLSLSNVVSPKASEIIIEEVKDALPVWIPVIFGIVTPISFTSSGLLVKHLKKHQKDFDASTISFSSYFVVNVIVILFAIGYWL